MSVTRVLCVDPDDAARTAADLRAALSDFDAEIETETAGSVAGAVESVDAAEGTIDCVVTEYDLPDGTGLSLVDRVRTRQPDAGCILFTSTDYDRIDTGTGRTTVAEYVDRGSEGAIGRLARLVRATVAAGAQTSYPLPQNEAERLATLESYDLDASGLEPALARTTDLAARHFDVPSASVNVVGDHVQEFLTCTGTAESWGTVARQDSICTFTLLADEPALVVEDVAADPRFGHNETLAELGIRAYMGAGVAPGSGPAIGTLCVYDEEPRSFSADDRTYLQGLAELAGDLIAARARAGRPPGASGEATGRGDRS